MIDVTNGRAVVPVTCATCWATLPVTLTVQRPDHADPWLRTDPADLAAAHLFAATHTGPFTLDGEPMIRVDQRILRP